MSSYSIIGVTVDVEALDSVNSSDFRDMWKTFSGKNAGICYMKDKYFNSYITDPEKALNRFSNVAGIGHHSIADHVNVTVLIENTSKMMAMLLNSLQDYVTSEKSGRYTEMVGNSEIERELYTKWSDIFFNLISKEYSNIDNSRIDKLAKENARYLLSVFTRSTVMSYTTSIRQWNYILDWINSFELVCISNLDSDGEGSVTYFERELLKDMQDLRDFIYNTLYIEELRDYKGRNFRFLSEFVRDISRGYSTDIGDTYSMKYTASFAYLAQAQRHRTLKYFMLFDGKPTGEYYIPEILKNYSDLKLEWVKDMSKVAHLIPQGMLIPIIECGEFYDFVLKCKERLCGRVQLEIMRVCVQQIYLMKNSMNIDDSDFSEYSKELLNDLYYDGKIKTKGMLIGGCKESCYFGCCGSIDRMI